MQTAEHVNALAAFFRRHSLELPDSALPRFERMGCALYAAALWRNSWFHGRIGGSGRVHIDGVPFERDELIPAYGGGAALAVIAETAEAGTAPDYNGTMVDRMALLMRRGADAGITVDADYLARAGIPEVLIAEFGPEAAELATAMGEAVEAYRRWRDPATRHVALDLHAGAEAA